MKNSAVGTSWKEFRQEKYTAAENAASDLRVSIMLEVIRARRERGISQEELGKISGITKTSIARIESGETTPTLATLQKLFFALGKKISIVNG